MVLYILEHNLDLRKKNVHLKIMCNVCACSHLITVEWRQWAIISEFIEYQIGRHYSVHFLLY